MSIKEKIQKALNDRGIYFNWLNWAEADRGEICFAFTPNLNKTHSKGYQDDK